MKKLLPLLIGLFIVINIVLGSIAGVSLIVFSEPVSGQEVRASRLEQTTPDSYNPGNVYYLCSPTITSNVKFLKGVPLVSDGSNPNLNLDDMVNGDIIPFPYPAGGQRAAKLKLNTSFAGQPFISLIINSLTSASKTIVVTIGLDTNDNYDSHVPTTLEHRCEFPPYQTTGDLVDGTMEEEIYQAYGTWQSGSLPYTIEKGRVILEITMTSPNGEEALTYCGFNYQLSWLAMPYFHNDLVPRAWLTNTTVDQGFPPYPPNQKIMVGDRVTFDASDSFDPNDDVNGNKKIDSSETDRLRYKWNWGDGTSTDFSNANKRTYHTYSAKDIPLTSEYRDFQVNLTVIDPNGHTDWNSTFVRVHRGDQSPEITSLKVNNNEQITTLYPELVTSILDKRVKVWFSASAIDKDNDKLTYHWDFDDNADTYEIEGNEVSASSIYYVFTPEKYGPTKHTITLTVSDGTLVDNATASCKISLKRNIEPVATIKAKREFDSKYYENNLTVKINQLITFYANESYDPDNLMGFDINNDNKTDFQLKYRWNFNIMDPSATSGWITDPYYEYSYLSAGNYKYLVSLDVDDGINVTTSEIFTVNINVRPVAKIIINPESYNAQGNLVLGWPVIFNGSSSYDPNGDPITNYTWEIGTSEGNIHEYDSIVEYTFEKSGKHYVSLVVRDKEFWSTEYEITVDIPEPSKSPIPRYSAHPREIYARGWVTFDASNTTDPDSAQKDLKFIWDFGDGTVYISRENSTNHKYINPGSYNVSLTVEDETGLNATVSNIILAVKNNLPVARIIEIKDVKIDVEVQVSGADSIDKDGEIVTYIWTFGDGSAEVRTNESQITHKWKNSGTYTIDLTVQDNDGGTDETQFQITIDSPSEDEGVFTEEQFTTVMAGAIITVIVIIVVIVVVFFSIRSRETI